MKYVVIYYFMDDAEGCIYEKQHFALLWRKITSLRELVEIKLQKMITFIQLHLKISLKQWQTSSKFLLPFF